jgi:hypothetical protein
VLVVGCGDVGTRVARMLGDRVRLLALSSSPERAPRLRELGITPLAGDLDRPATLARLAGLGTRVVHLAPPESDLAADWWRDFRTLALLRALRRRQSPYTPLVEAYTKDLGDCLRRSARSRASVRKSRHQSAARSPSGGARWITRVASPASRASVAGRSRSPASGVMPSSRRRGARSGDELRASSRTRLPSMRATRVPTSPHPTTSTRSRRKRAGRAPRGLWFEGTIDRIRDR